MSNYYLGPPPPVAGLLPPAPGPGTRRLVGAAPFALLFLSSLLSAFCSKRAALASAISRVPAALFLVDIGHEHIALAEARRLNITTFGMVDTNCDPNKVEFAIPANDDATKSIAIIVNYIAAAIAEGLAERMAEKDDDDNSSDSDETAEAKAARFEQKADSSDDRNKRARGAAPTKRRVPGPSAGGRRPAAGGGSGGPR